MPSAASGLTIKSLAEVAWLVSRVGRQLIDSQVEPSPTALRTFWQSTRQLQRSWDDFLEADPFESEASLAGFEEMAAQLLTTELLARVWATILGSIDQKTGREDMTRIAVNAVNGLLQIRHRLQSHLLNQAAPISRAADLDRLRRRCDRWTDMLIGYLCGREDYFRFAFDPDRARDFAEEANDSSQNPRSVELLMSAGIRLSFLGQLPDVPLGSPEFEAILQSILGSIPEQAFHRDGSLRTQLLPVEDPSDPAEDVLIPGISLAGLRRRFS